MFDPKKFPKVNYGINYFIEEETDVTNFIGIFELIN